MADRITAEERSRNMAAIRSRDTAPEIYIRKLLFSEGFRYRKNTRYIVGSPDLFLRKYNTAVFIHGCFWHRHGGCRFAYEPKSNIEFWNDKFERNVKRDQEVKQSLLAEGIKVLLIWECTIRKMKRDHDLEARILEQIKVFFCSSNEYLEL